MAVCYDQSALPYSFRNSQSDLHVTGSEVCYDRLGCFTDDVPWSGTVERPIRKLPWDPNKIDTQFLLYTRENPNNYQVRTVVL